MEYVWEEYVIASEIIPVKIAQYQNVLLANFIMHLMILVELPVPQDIIRIYTLRHACLVIVKNVISALVSQLYVLLAIIMRLIPK